MWLFMGLFFVNCFHRFCTEKEVTSSFYSGQAPARCLLYDFPQCNFVAEKVLKFRTSGRTVFTLWAEVASTAFLLKWNLLHTCENKILGSENLFNACDACFNYQVGTSSFFCYLTFCKILRYSGAVEDLIEIVKSRSKHHAPSETREWQVPYTGSKL